MKSLFRLLTAAVLMSIAVFTRAQAPLIGNPFYSGPSPAPTDPAAIALMYAERDRREEASALRENAKEAIQKGDMINAFSLLKLALSTDPREGEACVMLAYFYIQKDQPDNVIETLKPIADPTPGYSSSIGNSITTKMLYVQALLDRNSWREAVTFYEKTWHPARSPFRADYVPSHVWQLPEDGAGHKWPDPPFSVDAPNFPGLRAQVHLILGSAFPGYMEEKQKFPYMLEHLRQVLQINPKSLDATFLSGWLLRKMERFDEARAAFASAAQLGSPAVQKEINAELKKLKAEEASVKLEKAQQAALQAKPK